MRSIAAAAFGFSLTLSSGAAFAGFENLMEFYEAANGGNCVTCVWIAAEGVIEADTAERFLAFLRDKGLDKARGLNIHFNSPGGSLIGGVLLGMAIREQQANTTVSAAHVEVVNSSGLRKVTYDPPIEAECSSACVFAFVGGVSRFASKTTPGAAIGFQDVGRLGVHQFYDFVGLADPSAPAFDAEDRITDQKIISVLLSFLSEMDVSAELLQLASRTDPRDMHYLTEEELQTTRADNRMVSDVFIAGYPNGVGITEIQYARRDAEYRLEVYCSGEVMHMLATIDWRGTYDVPSHREWNLYDGVSLKDGGAMELVSEDFERRSDGGVTGKVRFRFADPLSDLVLRKQFAFEDWSSRYANNAALAMSFTLPDNFGGLHLLPRTCM